MLGVEPVLEGSRLDLGGSLAVRVCVPAEPLSGLLSEGFGQVHEASLPPQWCARGVWRPWPGETRRPVKDVPISLLPPSIPPCLLLLPSSFLLSSLPRCLPHPLSGRAMPEGRDQRVMAEAAASSTGSFRSESAFPFRGWGGRAGSPHTGCQLAGFGEELPWAGAASHLFPCLPPVGHRLPSMEGSCRSY